MYPLRVPEHAAKRQRPEARARGLRVAEKRRAGRGGSVAVELAASRQQRQPTRHAGGTVEMSLRRSCQPDIGGLKAHERPRLGQGDFRVATGSGCSVGRKADCPKFDSQRPGPRYPRLPAQSAANAAEPQAATPGPPAPRHDHRHWPATCPSRERQETAAGPTVRARASDHTRPEADTEMTLGSCNFRVRGGQVPAMVLGGRSLRAA